MPGRKRQADNRSRLPQAGASTLDWKNFNFLENMLLSCLMKERNVPPESGVKFRISRPGKAEALCLLFHIDRVEDPLIQQDGPRPDYLALYVSKGSCIFTIIEMKGKTEKELKHGVEQVVALKNILNRELSEHCSCKFKPVFQGILLCPPNADIPREQIKKEGEKGFAILPLQHPFGFELLPYVCRRNTLADIRYRDEKPAHDDKPGFIEDILVHKVLRRRISDNFYQKHFSPKERTGIYLNYALSEPEGYAVLMLDEKQSLVVVKEKTRRFRDQIANDLNNVGLEHFIVKAMD